MAEQVLEHAADEVPGAEKTPERAAKVLPVRVGLAVALVVPLLFVAMFSLSYLSAFHDPSPHRAPLALVGPPSVTEPIIAGLESARPDAFELVSETEIEPAVDLLRTRAVIGVVEIRADGVVAHTAPAAGNGTVPTVTAVADAVAASTGAPVSVVRDVPTAEGDGSGIALFYLVMICTIGAYIAVMVLPGVAGGLRLAGRFVFSGVIALLAPVVAFALAGAFVGSFGLGVRRLAVLVGVAVLYTFVVGVIALFAERLMGPASMILTMFLIMVMNLPSSGGPMAAAVLPPFWQSVHSFWFGSAAMETMRNIVYFPEAGVARHVGILLIWCVALVVAVVVVDAAKRARSAALSDAGA